MPELMLNGLVQCLSLMNLICMIGGLFIGIFFGALPGFTATMAVSVFVPFSFWLAPDSALLLLSGLFCGAIYGGGITAILLGIPGTPASLPTTFDGVPMVKRGETGRALGVITFCSSMGGFISALALLFGAPLLAIIALKVGPPEQFALTVFGLSVVCILTKGNMLKGFIVGAFTLILACVGQDPIHAYPRMTFGIHEIITGLPLIPILIGVFSLPEVFRMIETGINERRSVTTSIGRLLIALKDIRLIISNTLRSAAIGVGIGIVPAAGPDIASFIAYNQAIASSKEPKTFGKGNIQGIVASETANSACTGGSLIPLLTLGIPGSAPAALYLGALYIHGLRPGAQLFTDNANVTYALLMGFCLINIMQYFMGLFFCRIASKVVTISSVILVPCILILTMVGAYAIQQSVLDIWIMFISGVIGFFLTKYGFPISPVALGLILGPIMEQSFGLTMIMFHGNFLLILTRPLAIVFFALTIFSILWPFISGKIFKGKTMEAPAA